MLYQRVTGDFYTINSEGKFTLPPNCEKLAPNLHNLYNRFRKYGADFYEKIQRKNRKFYLHKRNGHGIRVIWAR